MTRSDREKLEDYEKCYHFLEQAGYYIETANGPGLLFDLIQNFVNMRSGIQRFLETALWRLGIPRENIPPIRFGDFSPLEKVSKDSIFTAVPADCASRIVRNLVRGGDSTSDHDVGFATLHHSIAQVQSRLAITLGVPKATWAEIVHAVEKLKAETSHPDRNDDFVEDHFRVVCKSCERVYPTSAMFCPDCGQDNDRMLKPEDNGQEATGKG